MAKFKKVYVVGPSVGYSRFIKNMTLVNRIEDADVVLFTGGEDISPELYGCKIHPQTWYNNKRDSMEVSMFKKVRPDQLVYGTCRGIQLICAMYGGILVQDCDNHWGGRHKITNGTRTLTTNSLHHQMQYPFNLPKEDYEILYWSKDVSTYYHGDGIDSSVIRSNCEPEIVVYHRPGMPVCLGVQGHPEMMPESELADLTNELIDKYL